jgi:hypothetical protein
MDGSQFDAWTRRRFGRAAGGVAGVLLARGGAPDAEAQKKRGCKKLGDSCKPGARRKCCKDQGLQCRPDDLGQHRCCRKGGTSCSVASQAKCCSGECIGGLCACKTAGLACDVDRRCCSGRCVGFTCE